MCLSIVWLVMPYCRKKENAPGRLKFAFPGRYAYGYAYLSILVFIYSGVLIKCQRIPLFIKQIDKAAV